MKQIAIVSGKGGTGKTTITSCFAALSKNAVIADCDVDAADLHIVLGAIKQHEHREEFKSGYLAIWDENKCNLCGNCIRVCRFGAISIREKKKKFIKIIPYLCEGCGCCVDICPQKALSLTDVVAGEMFVSRTRFGPFVHAKLGISQGNSGKLVSLVRQKAIEIAKRESKEIIIIDGSPGIGCPVIATLTGVQLAVVVTEATLSGLHDLDPIIKLCSHFKIQCLVILNKYDLNNNISSKIESYCTKTKQKLLQKFRLTESL